VVEAIPLLLLVLLVFGPLCSWLAIRKARRPMLWFLYGCLIGPFALLLLALAPAGRCAVCDAPTRGWIRECDVCGYGLTVARVQRAMGFPETGLPIREMTAPIEPSDARSARIDVRPEPRPLSIVPAGRGGRASRSRGNQLADLGDHNEVDMLATGIYIGGTAPLEIGLRYTIARHLGDLLVMGPIDTSPRLIRLRHPRHGLDATVHEDRLLISDPPGERSRLVVAFRSLAGTRGRRLEEALLEPGPLVAPGDALGRLR